MPEVQGIAYLFHQIGDILEVQSICRRTMLRVFDNKITFIDNTNLHCLPANCTGVLIAWSCDKNTHCVDRTWELGVLGMLHPDTTWVYRCSYNVGNGGYDVDDNALFFHLEVNHQMDSSRTTKLHSESNT